MCSGCVRAAPPSCCCNGQRTGPARSIWQQRTAGQHTQPHRRGPPTATYSTRLPAGARPECGSSSMPVTNTRRCTTRGRLHSYSNLTLVSPSLVRTLLLAVHTHECIRMAVTRGISSIIVFVAYAPSACAGWLQVGGHTTSSRESAGGRWRWPRQPSESAPTLQYC